MEYQSTNVRQDDSRGRSHRGRLTLIGAVAAGTLVVSGVAANAATGGHLMSMFTAQRTTAQQIVTVAVNKPGAGTAGGKTSASMPPVAFRTVINPADPTFNQLLGINDNGRVAGYFGSGADAAHPNKGYQVRPDYDRDDFTNENVPGSAQTQVIGINDAGTTVGFSVGQAGANAGFVLWHGRFIAVTNPAGNANPRFDQLLGVNNRGVAAGFYNDAAGNAHGYLYDIQHRKFIPVKLPVRADSVTATGVNDRGDISGFFTVGKVTSAFLVRDHHFTSISLGGRTNTQALGVNNEDQVVGSFVDAAGAMHGFVRTERGVKKIDDPHATAGTVVNGINNRDQIVGFYVDAAGHTDGFLARLTHS